MLIMKRIKLLITLALPVLLSHNLQAQSSSRLIAESQWNNNGSVFLPTDSASFTYLSNARGGDLTHTLKYDNSLYGTYIASTFDLILSTTQAFDANNNIISITTSNYTGTGFVLANKTLFTYNSSNLVTSMIRQSWNGTSWVPLTENIYSYTGANQLLTNQHETWNTTSSSFMLDSAKTYYYDASTGLLVNELDNYYSSSFPIYTNEYSYTYDSTTHYILSETESYSSSGVVTGFAPLSLTAYYYDSTGDLTELEKEHYNSATSAYVPDSLHAYSNFTSSHMPQTDDVKYWDSSTTSGGAWVNLIEFTNTYNTSHQLTSSTGVSWNVTGFYEAAVGDPMYNYYYGAYTNSTVSGVKTVVSNNGDANIYPVPAQNMLHIDLSWNEAQSATIAIYDVQGRMTKLWDAPYGTQYNSAVSVNDLAEGIYLIKISGQQGGEIVKQIVVSH
jgi:hypothetical protein